MIMSSFPEECLSPQWFDVDQPNPRLDIVINRIFVNLIERISLIYRSSLFCAMLSIQMFVFMFRKENY